MYPIRVVCFRLTSLLIACFLSPVYNERIAQTHCTDSIRRAHCTDSYKFSVVDLAMALQNPGCEAGPGAFWSRRIAKYVERPDYFGASRIPSEGFLRAWDFFARSPWRGDADRGFRTRNFARIPCASRNVVGECSLLRLALLAEQLLHGRLLRLGAGRLPQLRRGRRGRRGEAGGCLFGQVSLMPE